MARRSPANSPANYAKGLTGLNRRDVLLADQTRRASLARMAYGRTPTTRGVRTRRSRSTRTKRGKQANLKRLRRRIANLPSIGGFFETLGRNAISRVARTPENLLRTIYYRGGLSQLLSPILRIRDYYDFITGLANDIVGKFERETDEEDDEEEEEDYQDDEAETEEPQVIVIYRDKEEEEAPSPVTSTLGEHTKKLLNHLNNITSLLTKIIEKPYRRTEERTSPLDNLLNRNRTQESNTNIFNLDRTSLAALVGMGVGSLAGLLNWNPELPDFNFDDINQTLTRFGTRVGQIAVGGIAGASLGGRWRDMIREHNSNQRREQRQQRRDQRQERRNQNQRNRNSGRIRNAMNRVRGGGPGTLIDPSSGRAVPTPPTMLRSLLRTGRRAAVAGRRAAVTIARVVGGLPPGIVNFLRTCRRLVRLGGIASIILVPILEYIDAAPRWRAVVANEELTEQEKQVQLTQIVVEFLVNTLLTGLGALLLGGLVALIPLIGPFLAPFAGMLGAYIGQWAADEFNRVFSRSASEFLQPFINWVQSLTWENLVAGWPRQVRNTVLRFLRNRNDQTPDRVRIPRARDVPQQNAEQGTPVRDAALTDTAVVPPEFSHLESQPLGFTDARGRRVDSLGPERQPTPTTTPRQSRMSEPEETTRARMDRARTESRRRAVEQRRQNEAAAVTVTTPASEVSMGSRRASAIIIRDIYTIIYENNRLVVAK